MSQVKKTIIILNGSGGCGKDTFVSYLSKLVSVHKTSSIDSIKKIASQIAWDGNKDEKGRKLLSELKSALVQYNDFCLVESIKLVEDFIKSDQQVFVIDIREPQEIQKFYDKVLQLYHDNVTIYKVLVVRQAVKHIASNRSDDSVYDIDYDCIIDNNGTLSNLENSAMTFYTFFVKERIEC